jgi:pimeloyl-ACP methyl ester carboxylesterase
MSAPSAIPVGFEIVSDVPATAGWITMVHGLSQDRRVFSAQVDTFRERFNLLLIDLPGHGLSRDHPGPFGAEEYAAAIAAALQRANVRHCHFWGTHSGAAAGVLLACRQPQHFVSLILESPVFPGRPLPAVDNMLDKIRRVLQAGGIAAAKDAWWQESPWFAAMRANETAFRAAEHQKMLADFSGKPWLPTDPPSRPISPIDDALPQLEVPVLLINGEHDVRDFVLAADALASLLPNCRRAEIKDAGGFPLWECPTRVNELVNRFIDGLAS